MFKSSHRNTTAREALPPFEGHGPEGAERATFAAGCFWGVEATFRAIPGVLQTAVGYTQLLETFWRSHNPTTRHRQGLDFGSQYRSAIFYHGAAQEALAIESRALEQKSRRRQIVTEITPASAFYRAEEYHQRYLAKHGSASCAVTIGGEVTPAATP